MACRADTGDGHRDGRSFGQINGQRPEERKGASWTRGPVCAAVMVALSPHAAAQDGGPAPDAGGTSRADADADAGANPGDSVDAGPGDALRVLDAVTVAGNGFRGRSLSEFEPELVLSESDIAAYGVSSISDLLGIIEAETSSGKRRRDEPPVVLVNGRRVGGFRELDNYPVEALERVEVLPEEASLAYGFQPSQRVINFVLKANLRIVPINARTQGPRGGGTVSNTASVSRVVIDGLSRATGEVTVSSTSPLLEAERSITPFATGQDQAARTLVPQQTSLTLRGLRSFALPGDAVASVSARFADEARERLVGRAGPAQQILAQNQDTQTLDISAAINSALSANIWSLNARFEERREEAEIDLPQGGTSLIVSSVSQVAGLDANGNRRLWPRGETFAVLSGAAGLSSERLSATGSPSAAGTSLRRETAYGQATLSIPLSTQDARFGATATSLTGRIETVSDAGTLSEYGATLSWNPLDGMTVLLAADRADLAPTLAELNAPISPSFNQPVFDFAGEDTVAATVISGGNRALRPETRDTLKLGISWKPWEDRQLTVATDYLETRSADGLQTIIYPTPAIEDAFPGRVLRGPTRDLERFDQRTINVFAANETMLKSTLNWSIPIKAKRVTNPRPRSQTRRRSGRPGARRLSLIHRWMIDSTVQLTETTPPIDRLDGDGFDTALPDVRHIVDLTYYRWNNGWGVFSGLQYRSPGVFTTASGQLNVSETWRATVSVSYEFNFSDAILDAAPILEETRLSVGVGNVLDDVANVRDAEGQTPLQFERDRIDPAGLSWRVDLRKRF